RCPVGALATRASGARSLIQRTPSSLSIIREALTAGLTTATAEFRTRGEACADQLTALSREGATAVVTCLREALGSAASAGGLDAAKTAIRGAVEAVANRASGARSLIQRIPSSLSIIRDALTAGLTTATAEVPTPPRP